MGVMLGHRLELGSSSWPDGRTGFVVRVSPPSDSSASTSPSPRPSPSPPPIALTTALPITATVITDTKPNTPSSSRAASAPANKTPTATMPSLDTLPLDIFFIILSYAQTTSAFGAGHAFLALANTSKPLQAVVDSYCTHELAKLHNARPLSSPKPPFNKGPSPTRRLVRFRARHCEFCGAKTAETAKLYREIRCCRVCEKEQWPDKVTMTFATKNYNIPKEQLLKNVHYGQYMCYNVLTTIFLHADVKAYAETLHGPLPAFLARKSARRAARRAAAAERLRLRREELHGLLTLNGLDPATCYEELKWETEYTAPLMVVRRHILESRLDTEGRVAQRVHALCAQGYGPLVGTTSDPWQERLPPQSPRQRFPVDEALADMFVREFGPPDSVAIPSEAYRLRHEGKAFNEAFAAAGASFGASSYAKVPWEFHAYPVLLKEVFVAPAGRGEAWVRRRRAAVEARNARLEAEWEVMKAVYRRLIEAGEWEGKSVGVGGG
ncbi:hypothetical protein EDC01DRAFT_753691 [Geopyxis carbonaria]|nr:hypothetical protein EDC01DRAFT_753691 [Geopyxis carbonaria]